MKRTLFTGPDSLKLPKVEALKDESAEDFQEMPTASQSTAAPSQASQGTWAQSQETMSSFSQSSQLGQRGERLDSDVKTEDPESELWPTEIKQEGVAKRKKDLNARDIMDRIRSGHFEALAQRMMEQEKVGMKDAQWERRDPTYARQS